MGVYVAAFYPPPNRNDPAYQDSVAKALVERAWLRSRDGLCVACAYPLELGVCKLGLCGRPEEARRQVVQP
jgi:hypothetical protein